MTQKDSDNIQIELNKYSKSILDKYEDIELKNGKGGCRSCPIRNTTCI